MVSMNVKDYTKERCLVDEALKENKATARVKSAPVIRFSMTSSTMGRLRGMLFGDYDDCTCTRSWKIGENVMTGLPPFMG